MKNAYFVKSFLILLFVSFGLNSLWGQTTEDFESQTSLTASYADGSFVGAGGITFSYVHSRDQGDYAIAGKGIMLRRADEPSSIQFTVSNGIGNLSFNYRKAFTGGTDNRILAVVVNGTEQFVTPTFGGSGEDPTVHVFNEDINESGFVTIKITYPSGTSGGNRQITIDDISWTDYAGTPTQTATPNITATGEENGTDTYWNSAEVSISTSTPDATIYYTTDGNDPTTSSSVYSLPFTINSTTTVKAIATASGLDDSNIVTKEFTITTPASATIPYNEDFNNTLGDWISYTNAGVNWLPNADGASVNGYNSQSELVWLISPEFQSVGENGMSLSFDHTSDFTTGNDLEIRYSTNYAGFGDPTAATWTTVSTVTPESSGSVLDLGILVSGNVHIALVYTDISSPYAQWSVSNLSIEVPTSNPSISANPETVPDFNAQVGGTDDTEDVTISGINLVDDITVTISDNTNFSVSTASFAETDGTVNETLTLNYSPQTAGSHTATVTLSSDSADDVVLNLNGTASLSIPTATDATEINSSGFTANWNAVAGAESYELDVYTMEEGGAATDLFISEYVEGSGFNKGIELYNGTGADVDLSNYSLLKQTNGSGEYGSELTLSGTLENGGTYLIAYASGGNQASFVDIADLATSSGAVNFNGNDAVALFKNGTQIDEVGVFNQTSNWGADVTLRRKSDIGSPLSIYDENQWDSFPQDTFDGLGMHTFDGGAAITYVAGYEGLNVGNVTSNEVSGLDPETTYYYVVRAIGGGNETENSNEIETTTTAVPEGVIWTIDNEWSNGTGPTITDNVTIDGDLTVNSSNSFEAKSLTVNGSFEIQNGGVVTIDDTVVNNASSADFTIQDGGNLIQNNEGTNLGEITVNRSSNPMIRLEYTLWSSPVSNQQIQAFSPETLPERIYTYEGNSGYVQVADPTQDFTIGKGYMFRVPNDWDENTPTAFSGSFTGTPKNGALNISTYAGNFTSIGNPYPSNIDADLLMDINNGISTFYFWVNTDLVGEEYVGNNYATYTALGGTSADEGAVPNGIISLGQGFIVESTDASVNFDNSIRTSASTDFFKTTDIEKHRFWLNLYNESGNILNQILIGYMDGASSESDHGIDGKLFGYDGTALYNLIDNNAYTIQGRALPFEDTDVIPLGFKATETGNYRISLTDFDGLFLDGQEIFIKDYDTNTLHNLNEGDYNFNSDAGEFNTRFEIVFKDDETMHTDDLNANSVLIYAQSGNIITKSHNAQIQSVVVYDLQGRLVHENQNINALDYSFKSTAKSVFIIKVKTVDGKVTTKKLISQ